jgi:hypothetical protein
VFSPWALSGAGRAPVGSPHFSCGPGNIYTYLYPIAGLAVCVCVC